MIILVTTMNFLSTHCTACLRQINAYILYSSSYRLLRGLHLLVSPLSVLGLVSCVSIVIFCADNSYNTAPQAGTGRKACMNAHLQQTHTYTHYKWSCPHLQAYSISPLSAIIIHLKPPPTSSYHTPPSPSITLHLVERERGRLAILCESPQPSLQLPGSSVSGEGIVQRNSTLPTVYLLYREKPQGRGGWRRMVYADCKMVFTSECLGRLDIHVRDQVHPDIHSTCNNLATQIAAGY